MPIPAVLAAAYERAGAAAASILVDERFGGTWDDLRAARGVCVAAAPREGLLQDRGAPADGTRGGRGRSAAAAARPRRPEARRLLEVATELGLETLVEAHDAEELERAVALGAPVIGVNARDLATFDIDRDRAAEARRGGSSRSRRRRGERIESRAQGAAAELAGADAILVGSTLMRAADPAAKLAELSRARWSRSAD